MRNPTHRNAGFALMMAVFMIVTLAAIAVYVLTISTGQVNATTQDEQSARAYQAARAGVDWAAYRLLHDSSCASQTLTFTPASLSAFQAEVTCTPLPGMPETEGTTTFTVYRITVTGCNANPCTPATITTPGAATYVERQLQLTITK